MAGIYIHIPFCKQACHYCDFHFSTSLKNKTTLVNAICTELVLRKHELNQKIQTIYFGGGTPSLLSEGELHQIFETIYKNYKVPETLENTVSHPIKDTQENHLEVTLEANPDDLTIEKLKQLAKTPINRLSIGVQSFFEEDLKLMNRAHNAKEAEESIINAKTYFENISIDLIYGIPKMSSKRWMQNLEMAFQLEVPHLSCYALTVEPKTALKRYIDKGIIAPVNDDLAQSHHAYLVETAEEQGYINYEFSNFGKPSYFSKNNLGYWLGKPYLGIGPSAHSYFGTSRGWNVANNNLYIKAIEKNKLPIETEKLSKKDRYNEYVMTRLRTQWGIQKKEVQQIFGATFYKYLQKQAQPHIENHLLFEDHKCIKVSKKGKFLSDGIASDLFLLNL